LESRAEGFIHTWFRVEGSHTATLLDFVKTFGWKCKWYGRVKSVVIEANMLNDAAFQ
jgi:hypothetical protein